MAQDDVTSQIRAYSRDQHNVLNKCTFCVLLESLMVGRRVTAAIIARVLGYKFEIEIPWSIWGGEWSDSTHTMFGTRYRCLKKVNCLRSVLGEGL